MAESGQQQQHRSLERAPLVSDNTATFAFVCIFVVICRGLCESDRSNLHWLISGGQEDACLLCFKFMFVIFCKVMARSGRQQRVSCVLVSLRSLNIFVW